MFGIIDWNILRASSVAHVMPILYPIVTDRKTNLSYSAGLSINERENDFYAKYNKKILAFLKGWNVEVSDLSIKTLRDGIAKYIVRPDAKDWENMAIGELRPDYTPPPPPPPPNPFGEKITVQPYIGTVILGKEEEEKVYDLYSRLKFGINEFTGLPHELVGAGWTTDNKWYIKKEGFFFDAVTGEYYGNDVNNLHYTGIKNPNDLVVILNDVEWADMKNRILSRVSFIKLEERERIEELQAALAQEQKEHAEANVLGWDTIKKNIVKKLLGTDKLDNEIEDASTRKILTKDKLVGKTISRAPSGAIMASTGSTQLLKSLVKKTFEAKSFNKVVKTDINELLTPAPPVVVSQTQVDITPYVSRIAELEALLNQRDNQIKGLNSSLDTALDITVEEAYDPSKFKLTEEEQRLLDGADLAVWDDELPRYKAQWDFYYERIIQIVRGRVFQADIDTGINPDAWANAIRDPLDAFLKGINVARLGESIDKKFGINNARPVTDIFVRFLRADAARGITPDSVGIGQFLTRPPKRRIEEAIQTAYFPPLENISSLPGDYLESKLKDLDKRVAVVMDNLTQRFTRDRTFHTTPIPQSNNPSFRLRLLNTSEIEVLVKYQSWRKKDIKLAGVNTINETIIQQAIDIINNIWYININEPGRQLLKEENDNQSDPKKTT